ncbi:DUF6588 family protein [Ohtaekwangia koreensis]|uniref:Outer membrane protein beta-barrel domain-containing protein n=1 Tax=Ohtaekwangia koreensis TaxID=688867 RepID=A0A1T5J075_9BACT|nr:DUF6588 family protein [Ohtaekwangia koreensis]SKC44855.1 hypothetical protein SAMN05660236_0606 [Ohtaekwangia koreensis]
MELFKKTAVVFGLFFAMSVPTFAQDDIDELLRESVDDGKKLIDGYISPFMKSVTLGLNSGWYNTAKTHKIVGIDLTVTASAMTIPKSDLFYDVTKLGLTKVELVQPGDPMYPAGSPDYPNAPTIFGPDRSPQYKEKGNLLDQPFDGPSGLDLKGNVGKNWMPVPMVHLGIGLPKGTDLKIRFTPSIDLDDDSQFKLFGIGVMHDVKQYIPGLKLLPFDLSAFVGYTRLSLDYKYTSTDIQTENARGEMVMNATTMQAVISKKVSVLTVYGGLGYNIAKSNLSVLGKWDVNNSGTYDADEIDPVQLNYAASGPRVTAGFRLKLAVFTLHADYTLQKYNALTVGFGINVR